MPTPPESNPSDPDALVTALRQSIGEILTLAAGLHPWVPEFGPEGAENLTLIESSGREVRKRLETALSSRASDPALEWLDKDLRHDFRNLIGAVSGFAELILMESPESCEARPRVIRLRQCAKTFVELIER